MAGETSNIGDASGKADKLGRVRSSIEFPYSALDDAESLAKGVRDVGATACDWNQLAAHLNFAAQGGGFRVRMLGAKIFNLITYDRGRVELTDIGIRIVDPRFTRSARVESFLSVPLYKAAFEKLNGQTLPPAAAIERLLESLGVAPKQKDKARQAFMRSAKHAGFMEIAQDRLTLPRNLPPASDPSDSDPDDDSKRGRAGGGGGGDDGGAETHHFIRGLLNKLPTPETEWPVASRIKWLKTAAHIFDMMYGDEPEIEIKLDHAQARQKEGS